MTKVIYCDGCGARIDNYNGYTSTARGITKHLPNGKEIILRVAFPPMDLCRTCKGAIDSSLERVGGVIISLAKGELKKDPIGNIITFKSIAAMAPPAPENPYHLLDELDELDELGKYGEYAEALARKELYTKPPEQKPLEGWKVFSVRDELLRSHTYPWQGAHTYNENAWTSKPQGAWGPMSLFATEKEARDFIVWDYHNTLCVYDPDKYSFVFYARNGVARDKIVIRKCLYIPSSIMELRDKTGKPWMTPYHGTLFADRIFVLPEPKIGYKVVHENYIHRRSWDVSKYKPGALLSASPWGVWVMEYEVKEWVKRPLNGGPLALYPDIPSARDFLREYGKECRHIYKCAYMPSKDNHLWTLGHGTDNGYGKTRFADEVKLIEEVK